MLLKNTNTQFGFVTKFTHGLVAFIIILQMLGGLFHHYIPRQFKGTFFTLHKSFGIVVFFLMLFFIVWHWCNKKPGWPVEMKAWERCLAKLTHRLLFILFLIMPLSGWGMSTAAGYPPNFFWLGKLPLPFIEKNKALAHAFNCAHEITAYILIVVIALHILGALKHHCCDKNNLLRRMFW